MRVDFYIQPGAGAQGLARLACRLIEKAWSAGQRVCVFDPDPASLEALDTLLWTFAEGSFVPHERLSPFAGSDAQPDAPVLLLGAAPAPSVPRTLLLNRGVQVPEFAREFERVIELVDDEPARREAARARYRVYRQLGCEPSTHTLSVRGD